MSKKKNVVVVKTNKGRPASALKRQIIRKAKRIRQSSGRPEMERWYESQSHLGTFTLGSSKPVKISLSLKEIDTALQK